MKKIISIIMILMFVLGSFVFAFETSTSNYQEKRPFWSVLKNSLFSVYSSECTYQAEGTTSCITGGQNFKLNFADINAIYLWEFRISGISDCSTWDYYSIIGGENKGGESTTNYCPSGKHCFYSWSKYYCPTGRVEGKYYCWGNGFVRRYVNGELVKINEKSQCSEFGDYQNDCLIDEPQYGNSISEVCKPLLTTCTYNNKQYKVGDEVGWRCSTFDETRIDRFVVTGINVNGICNVEPSGAKYCPTGQECNPETAQCVTIQPETCTYEGKTYKSGDFVKWTCTMQDETWRLGFSVLGKSSSGVCTLTTTEKQVCGKTWDLKQKICENGECVAPPPPPDETCTYEGKQYKLGDFVKWTCTMQDETWRLGFSVLGKSSSGVCTLTTTEKQVCGKTWDLKQKVCKDDVCVRPDLPTDCSSRCGGTGLFDTCSTTNCHSIGCFVSEQDKGLNIFAPDNLDRNLCVSQIPREKQCDLYFEDQKKLGKKVNQTMDDTCITNYCKKVYVEKNWFEKLMSAFISTKKPIYICSEKPEGYCKYFIWAEKLPFADGENACQIGTLLILIIIGGIGYFIYLKYYKKGKKRKKKRKRG